MKVSMYRPKATAHTFVTSASANSMPEGTLKNWRWYEVVSTLSMKRERERKREIERDREREKKITNGIAIK